MNLKDNKMSEDTERHAMKMAKKKAARDKIMATKKFKPHKMYSKTGIVKDANTMKQHLSLKGKGYNHDSRRANKK